MPADLYPIAANAGIALTLLTLAYLLRGQSGRHTTGMTRPHAPYTNPLTPRQRDAVRHYAHLDLKDDRQPYVNGVNTGVTL